MSPLQKEVRCQLSKQLSTPWPQKAPSAQWARQSNNGTQQLQQPPRLAATENVYGNDSGSCNLFGT